VCLWRCGGSGWLSRALDACGLVAMQGTHTARVLSPPLPHQPDALHPRPHVINSSLPTHTSCHHTKPQVPPAAAALPPELRSTRLRRTALADWLTRRLGAEANRASAAAQGQAQGWHGAKGGDVHVDVPGALVCACLCVFVLSIGNI
jgi:hypothetical protein